jgi:flagella basal body P-ring formation protein FlgA
MRRLSLTAIAAVLLVLVATAAAAQSAVTIRLKDLAEVKGDTILVSHLAQVEAAVPEMAAVIGDLRVADAPAINSTATITAAQVRTALDALALDMSRVSFEGPERVRVSRTGRIVTAEALKSAVREHVVERTGVTGEDLILEFIRVPNAFAVAEGELTYTIVPVSNNRYSGYQVFSVCARVDGIETETVRVTVKIRIFREVAVTVRRLMRDEVIADEHVRLERREVTSSVGSYYMSLAVVVGKRATRSVSAGVVLTDVMVGDPLAVRRDDVTARARDGAVRVRTKCIALADGCVGESIDVMNNDSKKVIRARVVAPSVVELEL